jgi:hypothetical protein
MIGRPEAEPRTGVPGSGVRGRGREFDDRGCSVEFFTVLRES